MYIKYVTLFMKLYFILYKIPMYLKIKRLFEYVVKAGYTRRKVLASWGHKLLSRQGLRLRTKQLKSYDSL